ncbi:MAG: HAD family hydrolase [Thermaurantiacus sp.]
MRKVAQLSLSDESGHRAAMSSRTIVFDLDGTLVDTAEDLAASLNHALGVLGRPPIDPASVRPMVGQGARALLQKGLVATGAASPALVERGVEPFLDFYAANIAVWSRPYPLVEEVLERLAARGDRLAICTNKPAALSAALIDALGWAGRFAALLGADSLPVRKPDPAHLLRTIEAAGGTWEDALFVGDSVTDAKTAEAARVPLVLVRHGYSTIPVDTLPAQAVIDGFHQLEDALAQVQAMFNPDSR